MGSPLSAGAKLGRYDIRSKLGAGGMGEVYLAQDTKLDRKVAIKILPEDLASNPHSMQRFVQEAKAASALNHPNILTIHEIGTEPGAHFIVAEFVDGETLRRRMTHAQLTMAEAIDIALQIASALSTAHAAGIIHRDIKPENIMLRRDGIVKVLDFGLAKLTERSLAEDVDHDAATKAMVQTEPGVIVGTTAYMSPEQTRALVIDTRTDIWSLGVVLYEMTTGHAPFKSETASDTSAAILKTEPAPLSQYLPDTPFELERIVRKALQKDREERYQVVKDLQLDLKSLKRDLDLSSAIERVGSVSSQTPLSTGASQRTTGSALSVSTQRETVAESHISAKNRWLWVGTMILVSILVVGSWYFWRHRGDSNAVRFSNLAVKQLVSRKNALGEIGPSHARFSPDGKLVAYASAKDGGTAIWLKQVGSGEPFSSRSEQGTAASPIWSPDGQQIAFLSKRDAQNGIWTMPSFGGSPTLVKELERSSRELITWSKGGRIYFIVQGSLFALDVASQQISEVVKFDSARPLDRAFSVSPDEERIAYSDVKDGQRDIWVVARSGGLATRVTNDVEEDTNPVWTPDGQNILYSSKRNGIKQIFLAFLDNRGPVQLTVNDTNSEVLDISPDGTQILYATARDESDLWSVKLDRPKETQLTSDTGIEFWPDVAPDGKTVAFQATDATTGTTLFNCLVLAKSLTSEAQPTRLAPDGFAPRWSPDGKQIAFLRYTSGPPNLWTVHAAGGDAKPLTSGGINFGGFTLMPYNRSQTQDFQWSPDSSRLVFCANTSGLANVWQIASDGTGVTQISDNTDANLHFFDPFWSPDTQTVAWLALSIPPGQKKISWSIWLARAGKGQQIFQADSVLGIVGWSPSGQELIIKTIAGLNNAPNVPGDVSLSTIPVSGGTQRSLAQLKATYFQNIKLAPGRNQIAFVTRQDGADRLEVISATGGAPRAIIDSNDPRVYFSDLVWSADGRTIYYGKQASWTSLSMIENFK